MPGTTQDTFGVMEAVDITVGAQLFPDGGPARAIYVGVSGDVTVEMLEGSPRTFKNLAAGMWHGMSFKRVTAATATDMLAGR